MLEELPVALCGRRPHPHEVLGLPLFDNVRIYEIKPAGPVPQENPIVRK